MNGHLGFSYVGLLGISKCRMTDGTTSEIEVSDELYTLHLEIVQQKRRLHWRESRRQISLDNLTEQGIDFADTAANPLADYILKLK